jgi:ABC-type nitrate/sulfonate/bicarbonate transport system permease component
MPDHTLTCRSSLHHPQRWHRLALREFSGFAGASLGGLFNREFLRLSLPLLILWELLPRLAAVSPSLLPPPSLLARTFAELLLRHQLLEHLAASMLRFSLGFTLAVATAIPLGVLLGWNDCLRRHALPLFQILAPIPPTAWVPVAIILLGVGLPMQLFLIFLGVFYPVFFNTYQGVKETDHRYLASARVFGASEFTLITHVYLWHALGAIVMGIRIGIALGLTMLVLAEMYGGHNGLGALLLKSKEYFRIDRMMVCMLLLGGIGWFLTELFRHLERKLAIWRIER